MTTPQTPAPRPWYRRWPAITGAPVLGVALLAGTASAATGTFTSHPAAPRPAATAPAKTAPAKTAPARTAPATTRPAAPAAPAQQAPPQYSYTNSVSVVTQFYQDITDHNYAAAWALGGDNIGGTDYTSWVNGYGTTESISLGEFSQFGSSQVQVNLSALQSDGTTNDYTGTYTVTGGVITAASITQTSGGQSQATPAQPQPGSADTSCGGGVYAGPSTSCSFAQNVAAAYSGPGPDTETVYSPATGSSYTMTYSQTGSLVEATGGNNADVLFYPAS